MSRYFRHWILVNIGSAIGLFISSLILQKPYSPSRLLDVLFFTGVMSLALFLDEKHSDKKKVEKEEPCEN